MILHTGSQLRPRRLQASGAGAWGTTVTTSKEAPRQKTGQGWWEGWQRLEGLAYAALLFTRGGIEKPVVQAVDSASQSLNPWIYCSSFFLVTVQSQALALFFWTRTKSFAVLLGHHDYADMVCGLSALGVPRHIQQVASARSGTVQKGLLRWERLGNTLQDEWLERGGSLTSFT